MLTLAPWLQAAAAGIRGRLTWYAAAAIGLLAVAAALRFYELGQLLAYRDEAIVALNSGGTLGEVLRETRGRNSSPLLYPFLLWAVQQIDQSPFSMRVVPALSSVLAVGVILLLPRWGVRRDAALLAAILAALAPAAIYEARGAREYGIDALVAALLIAGLLWYRHNGRKALLCGALLVAPLLQYGLVLFGAAVIGVGLLLPPSPLPVGQAKAEQSRGERIRGGLRRRVGLAGPAALFGAGCAISYLTTLTYQLTEQGGFGKRDGYYESIYFGGEYQIIPVLEFAVASVRDVASYHLPWAVIAAVAVAVAIGLLSAGFRRLGRGRNDWAAKAGGANGAGAVIGALLPLTLAIAIAAAVLGEYPATASRHSTYLGPAVFVFSGVALAAAIQKLARLTPFRARVQRERLALALSMVAAALIIGASGAAIQQVSPYSVGKADDFFGVLEQSVQQNDIVYTRLQIAFIRAFYGDHYGLYNGSKLPDNYIITRPVCKTDPITCIRDISNLAMHRDVGSGNVWVILFSDLSQHLERYDEKGTLELVAESRHPGSFALSHDSMTLHRFPADGGLLHNVRREWLAEYRGLLTGKPTVKGHFNVYYSEDRLTYDREPCAPADATALFFLHIFPTDLNSLSERYRERGFENRDFDFLEGVGALLENRCIISVALPEYDIASIRTGQYTDAGRIWQVNIPVQDQARYVPTASQEPAARAVFNLHFDADSDTLLYAKAPCAASDTAASFFLHITPADPAALPEPRRQHGFDNRDFSFDPDGMRFDGKCFIRRPLPQYEIAGIRTGQYTDAGRIWEVELAP